MRHNALIGRLVAVSGLGLLGAAASAAEHWLPDSQELFGEIKVVAARYEDTFVGLARAHNVGFEALRRANPDIDPWLPGEGTPVVIPTQFVLPRAPREGIVVNVAELRLYYFPSSRGTAPEGLDAAGRRVITYPISVGRMDWRTPLGTTSIVGKVANPSWYPPQSIREEHAARNDLLPQVVPPGPDNPLGQHALRLALPGYLIHGTNKPSGVGMRVTHGCIRMFPEDIEALYTTVPSGTRVHIVDQPYKMGWGNDGLYLEAHPPLPEVAIEIDEITAESESAPIVVEPNSAWTVTELTRLFVAATEARHAEVSWDSAERVMQAARGIPEFISIEAVADESLAADGALELVAD
jgi:L,D-transpeptidase ErfK/SrfK